MKQLAPTTKAALAATFLLMLNFIFILIKPDVTKLPYLPNCYEMAEMIATKPCFRAGVFAWAILGAFNFLLIAYAFGNLFVVTAVDKNFEHDKLCGPINKAVGLKSSKRALNTDKKGFGR